MGVVTSRIRTRVVTGRVARSLDSNVAVEGRHGILLF